MLTSTHEIPFAYLLCQADLHYILPYIYYLFRDPDDRLKGDGIHFFDYEGRLYGIGMEYDGGDDDLQGCPSWDVHSGGSLGDYYCVTYTEEV